MVLVRNKIYGIGGATAEVGKKREARELEVVVTVQIQKKYWSILIVLRKIYERILEIIRAVETYKVNNLEQKPTLERIIEKNVLYLEKEEICRRLRRRIDGMGIELFEAIQSIYKKIRNYVRRHGQNKEYSKKKYLVRSS